MSINWLEVIASIVNFLVLLFLLRRFLYEPIVRVMDQREQTITRREKEAAGKAARAEKEAAAYRKKTTELKAQQGELLDEARRAAAAERDNLTAAARREVDETRRQWYGALEQEKESFARELRRQVAAQACLVARSCLRDLADAPLEAMTWKLFLKKLGAMPGEELFALKKAIHAAETVKVNSAFTLDESKLKKLKIRLQELLSEEPVFDYQQEPNLICGLELEAEGYRIAWSMENYLEDVEQQISKSLEAVAQRKGGVAGGSPGRR